MHEIQKNKSFRLDVPNILFLISFAAILLLVGFFVGRYASHESAQMLAASEEIENLDEGIESLENQDNVSFSIFVETWNLFKTKYVDQNRIDPQKMLYGAIKGVVASAEDPYTFFLTPEENQESKDSLNGTFEGIGAQLGLRDNRVIVVAPLKNSPAIQAGLQGGDFIIAVDGESTEGKTLNEVVSVIRGERGTPVTLTVQRGEEELDIEIIRDSIQIESVELEYETDEEGNSVAHLKLNQFGDNTIQEWNAAINEIQNRYESEQLQGMILDLRNNPGGYLDGSVYIASEFIPQGQIVVTQESTIEGNSKEYKSNRKGKLLDIPLVVMLNEGSASASEILAGALRDYDRTIIVGKKSFGKGSVQEALDLSGGAGLHVTVAKWILPDGKWIDGEGITPDIEVENEIEEGNTLTRENDAQLNRAIEEVINN